jgi:hypothetical protein
MLSMNKIKSYYRSVLQWLAYKDNRIKFCLVLWFSAMWSWTLFTDSLDLAGSKSQGLILAVIISAINVALSTWIVWKTWLLLRKLFSKRPVWQALLLALPIVALMDFLVAWLVAIIWIGPQGLIDSVLPLSSPALLFVNTPLSFASRLVGFYGLGAFAWLTLFLLTEKKFRIYALVPLATILALSTLGWLGYRSVNGASFTATVISENLTTRVPQIDSSQTNLIIFPEYGLDQITNENLAERLTVDKDGKKTAFLGSEQVNPINKTGHLNRLLFGNSQDGITSKQDKYRLIPGGEDLPYTLRVALRATNQKATLDYFSLAKSVIRGPAQLSNFVINESTALGTAVCSSIISPEDYRTFVNNGATALTNSASLTIFKGSRVFSWQQKSLAKFMAVSNSRYFMQSANGSRAYILSNNGQTLAEDYGVKTASATVYNNSHRTPYTQVGEWLVYTGVLVAIASSVGWLYNKQAKKAPAKKTKRYNKE